MKIPHDSIGLFMTLGVGLRNWEKIGSLARELELYYNFAKRGWNVTIFTYDRAGDIPSLKPGIRVRTKIPKFLPQRLYWLYSLLMPFLFYAEGKKLDILKTNQAHSGWPAIWCGLIWRKKMIARCGYVFGESTESLHMTGIHVSKKKLLERITFKRASLCFVPTEKLRNWVLKHYKVPPSKIKIMPNCVNVDIFKPTVGSHRSVHKKIISVGRLVPVKRFELLIDALEGEDWSLIIIGEGSLRNELKHRTRQRNVSLKLMGNTENQKLPPYLNNTDIFVICSRREGHPKSLIEAMACGCACVGTDSPGIRDVIIHGENGFICSSNPKSLKEAIKTLLLNKSLRNRIRINARDFAVKHFSSCKIIEKELKLISELVGEHCAGQN